MRRNKDRKAEKESLNQLENVPTIFVMRGRVIAGLSLGATGLVAALAGAISSSPIPTLAGAIIVIAAGLVTVWGSMSALFRHTGDEPGHLSSRIDAVTSQPGLKGATPSAESTEGSVIDPVTELPDARYFEVAVEGRVAAARRHLWPVSIVLLQLGFDESIDNDARNKSLASFSALMRQTLREADIACRLNDSTFGLILEDTSEEGGVWTAERLQIALSHDTTKIRRLVAGVAAYPTHGLFSKDVLVRAQAALTRASSTPTNHGLGQVEVAHVDLS